MHLLHGYMNVKWISVSSDAQVRTSSTPPLFVLTFNNRENEIWWWSSPFESLLSGGLRLKVRNNWKISGKSQNTFLPPFPPVSALCFSHSLSNQASLSDTRTHSSKKSFLDFLLNTRVSLLCPKPSIHRPLCWALEQLKETE